MYNNFATNMKIGAAMSETNENSSDYSSDSEFQTNSIPTSPTNQPIVPSQLKSDSETTSPNRTNDTLNVSRESQKYRKKKKKVRSRPSTSKPIHQPPSYRTSTGNTALQKTPETQYYLERRDREREKELRQLIDLLPSPVEDTTTSIFHEANGFRPEQIQQQSKILFDKSPFPTKNENKNLNTSVPNSEPTNFQVNYSINSSSATNTSSNATDLSNLSTNQILQQYLQSHKMLNDVIQSVKPHIDTFSSLAEESVVSSIQESNILRSSPSIQTHLDSYSQQSQQQQQQHTSYAPPNHVTPKVNYSVSAIPATRTPNYSSEQTVRVSQPSPNVRAPLGSTPVSSSSAVPSAKATPNNVETQQLHTNQPQYSRHASPAVTQMTSLPVEPSLEYRRLSGIPSSASKNNYPPQQQSYPTMQQESTNIKHQQRILDDEELTAMKNELSAQLENYLVNNAPEEQSKDSTTPNGDDDAYFQSIENIVSVDQKFAKLPPPMLVGSDTLRLKKYISDVFVNLSYTYRLLKKTQQSESIAKKETKKKQEEVEKLQRELAQLQTYVKYDFSDPMQLEQWRGKELSQKTKELKDVKSENRNLNMIVSNLKEELEKKHEAGKAFSEEIDRLNSELTESHTLLHSRRKEINSLSEKVKALEIELQQRSKPQVTNIIPPDIQQKLNSLKITQDNLEKTQLQNTKLIKENSSLRTEIARIHEETRQREEDMYKKNINLENQLETLKQTFQQNEEIQTQARETIQQLKEQSLQKEKMLEAKHADYIKKMKHKFEKEKQALKDQIIHQTKIIKEEIEKHPIPKVTISNYSQTEDRFQTSKEVQIDAEELIPRISVASQMITKTRSESCQTLLTGGDMENQSVHYQKHIQDLMSENRQVSDLNKSLQSKFFEFKEKHKELQQQLDSTQEQYERVKSDLERSTATVSQLQSHLTQLHQQHQLAVQERETLRHKTSTLENSLQDNISNLQKENTILQEKLIEATEQTKKELEKVKRKFRKEKEQAIVQTCEKMVQERQQMFQDLQRQLSALNDQYNRELESNNNLSQENELLKAKIGASIADFENLQRAHEELKRKLRLIEKYQKKISQMNDEIGLLKSQIQELKNSQEMNQTSAQSQITVLQTEIVRLTESNSLKEKRIKSLTNQAEALRHLHNT